MELSVPKQEETYFPRKTYGKARLEEGRINQKKGLKLITSPLNLEKGSRRGLL